MPPTASSASSPDASAAPCPRCHQPIPAGATQSLCPACLLAAGFFTQASPDAAAAPDLPPPAPADLAPEFPGLEIIELLGQGGMGAVYKARQRHLDRLVALKLLRPGLDADPSFAERFTREARALAQLNHPGIVTLHEFGRTPGGLYFIVMEFVDGLNLRQLLAAGRIAPREALAIVPPLCDALQYAHDRGLVHRDIKPENILIDRLGRVKIADFGLAKLTSAAPSPDPASASSESSPLRHSDFDIRISGDALSAVGHVMGTPRYMAPEQRDQPAAVDHRADIYALGVVLYQMLTGELPDEKHLQPPSRRVQLDVRLDEVVLRALEHEPARRYQQANQIKTHLETFATPASPGPSTAQPLPPPSEPPPSIPPPLTPPPGPAPDFAAGVLARDYQLNIRSCMRRGWALLRSDFWPLVGLTALVLVLVSAVNPPNGTGIGSVLTVVVSGPLFGGLNLHFLQRIRGLPGGVNTVFSSFRTHFLHLFLGSFVASSLTALGFLCLVLPGIYLFVAWLFTLPLIIDRNLEFWPAMQLSRRVVAKHWWKLFGLVLTLGLLGFAGLLALLIGIFVAAPLIVASLMFAYEDIFNPPPAAPASASVSVSA